MDSLIFEPHLSLSMERVKLNLGGQHSIRLALVADTHFTSDYLPPTVEQAVKAIERSKADLVIVAGDLVSSREGWSATRRFLSQLRSISPVIVVWGNHDHWHLNDLQAKARELRSLDITILTNENTRFDGLRVVGVDDPYTGHSDLSKAISGLKEGPRILIAHSPQIIGEAKGIFELVVSGHTHGGQVRIPLLGPPFVLLPKRYRKYVSGLYRVEGTWLYVNRGLGTSFLPIRFNCPPELTIIDVT